MKSKTKPLSTSLAVAAITAAGLKESSDADSIDSTSAVSTAINQAGAQAPVEAATPAVAPAPAPSAAPEPAPPPAPVAAPYVPVVIPVDEHHGQGGVYELIDGVRVLMERTQEAPAA